MEKCDKCGRNKDMYYGSWCPTCEAPKPINIETINLIKCLRHLEAQGNKGIEKAVLSALELINDTYITIYWGDKEEKSFYKDEAIKGFRTLKYYVENTCSTGKNVLFEVSW